jgi:hypothetical protein
VRGLHPYLSNLDCVDTTFLEISKLLSGLSGSHYFPSPLSSTLLVYKPKLWKQTCHSRSDRENWYGNQLIGSNGGQYPCFNHGGDEEILFALRLDILKYVDS